MAGGEQVKSPREIEQLATSIREMASQMNAQFVLDGEKTQNYLTASEQRGANYPNKTNY